MNDGGPAFPHHLPQLDENGVQRLGSYGMTLRDWLAGQAMAARVIALGRHTHEGVSDEDAMQNVKLCHAETAERAYSLADVMLNERSRSASAERVKQTNQNKKAKP